MRPLAAAALALALFGCPKDEPGFDENDPLIKKLKAEQQRLEREGPPRAPPAPRNREPEPDPLAEAAARGDAPTPLTVPAAPPVAAGGATLSVKAAETSHTVKGAKMALSSADLFVRVTLTATAARPETLDLASATLALGEERFGIARDAQKLGQGSPLLARLEPGVSQSLVLYFEAPPAAVKKGLKLILSSGGSAVELPLQ